MRLSAASIFFFLALIPAAPAAAQIAGSHIHSEVRRPNPFIGDSRLRGPSVERAVRDLRNRIDRARESGAISLREARRLKREARHIGWVSGRYGSDGLSASERSELEARAHYLRDAVNRAGSTGAGTQKSRVKR